MAALGFTPASGQDVFSIETAEQCSSTLGCVISGKEARQFYEDLITDVKGEDESRSARSKKEYRRKHQNKQRNGESSRRTRRTAEMQRGQTDSVVQRERNSGGEGNQTRETSSSERSIELQGLRLLHCAHEGDTSGLKDLLSKGVDINFQVQYCSAYSAQCGFVSGNTLFFLSSNGLSSRILTSGRQ